MSSEIIDPLNSSLIEKIWQEHENAHVVLQRTGRRTKYAVVYFSSHALYENSCQSFQKKIIENDYFEFNNDWWRNEVPLDSFYFRDVRKQWYVGGINSNAPSLISTMDQVRALTAAYECVFCVGISAGGFMALACAARFENFFAISFSGFVNLNVIGENNSLALNWVKSSGGALEFSQSNARYLNFLSSGNELDKLQLADCIERNIDYISIDSCKHGLQFSRFTGAEIVRRFIARQSSKKFACLHKRVNSLVCIEFLYLFPFNLLRAIHFYAGKK